MSVAVSAPPAAPTDPTAGASLAEPAGTASPDPVRWGPFCCLLVPAAFAVYGTRFGSAVFWSVGLAAVAAVCRLLLHRSARDTARDPARDTARAAVPARLPSPARGADGAHRGGR